MLDEVEGVAATPPVAADDAALRRHIEALPDKQRQAITLYYLDERPVNEVAEMMGPAGQHGEDAPASRPREPSRPARRRGGGARMSADDPGRTHFDARMAARVRGSWTLRPASRRGSCSASRRKARRHARTCAANPSVRAPMPRVEPRAPEAWTNVATAVGIGAAGIVVVWRHRLEITPAVQAARPPPRIQASSWSSRWPSSPPEFWPALRRYVTPL